MSLGMKMLQKAWRTLFGTDKSETEAKNSLHYGELDKLLFDLFCILCIIEETDIMKWLMKKLREPSTFAGIAVLATLGEHVVSNPSPEGIGATVAAVLAMVMNEKGDVKE